MLSFSLKCLLQLNIFSSVHFTANLASLHPLIMQYQTGTHAMLSSPFPRYPSLEFAGRPEVHYYCLDGVWRDVQTNVPLHVENQRKAAVALGTCIVTLLFVVIIHFELLNFVGLIDVSRRSL